VKKTINANSKKSKQYHDSLLLQFRKIKLILICQTKQAKKQVQHFNSRFQTFSFFIKMIFSPNVFKTFFSVIV